MFTKSSWRISGAAQRRLKSNGVHGPRRGDLVSMVFAGPIYVLLASSEASFTASPAATSSAAGAASLKGEAGTTPARSEPPGILPRAEARATSVSADPSRRAGDPAFDHPPLRCRVHGRRQQDQDTRQRRPIPRAQTPSGVAPQGQIDGELAAVTQPRAVDLDYALVKLHTS